MYADAPSRRRTVVALPEDIDLINATLSRNS
jgi:hypothetical protein